MAVVRDDQQFIDTTQQATRVINIGGGGGTGVERDMLNTLLTGGADRVIPAGRKGFTVVLSTKAGAGSPTLDGVELPAVGTYTYSADGDDTLASATVATAAGDIVLVMELF